jgi:hypothetical protein
VLDDPGHFDGVSLGGLCALAGAGGDDGHERGRAKASFVEIDAFVDVVAWQELMVVRAKHSECI